MPFFHTPLSKLTSYWRIFHEEAASLVSREEQSDYEELRGHAGTYIYRHGQATLAVSTENSVTFNRLLALSSEMRTKTANVILFPDHLLDTVARAIRARYRRQYTEEELTQLRERAKEMRVKNEE